MPMQLATESQGVWEDVRDTPEGMVWAIRVSVSVGELGSPACSTGALPLNMLSQNICKMSG